MPFICYGGGTDLWTSFTKHKIDLPILSQTTVLRTTENTLGRLLHIGAWCLVSTGAWQGSASLGPPTKQQDTHCSCCALSCPLENLDSQISFLCQILYIKTGTLGTWKNVWYARGKKKYFWKRITWVHYWLKRPRSLKTVKANSNP